MGPDPGVWIRRKRRSMSGSAPSRSRWRDESGLDRPHRDREAGREPGRVAPLARSAHASGGRVLRLNAGPLQRPRFSIHNKEPPTAIFLPQAPSPTPSRVWEGPPCPQRPQPPQPRSAPSNAHRYAPRRRPPSPDSRLRSVDWQPPRPGPSQRPVYFASARPLAVDLGYQCAPTPHPPAPVPLQCEARPGALFRRGTSESSEVEDRGRSRPMGYARRSSSDGPR